MVALLHVAGFQRQPFLGQVGVNTAVVGGGGARDEFLGQRGFQDAAHGVDLARLVGVRLADKRTLVGNDVDQLVLGQHQQRRADLGAADLVDPRQRLFAQPGAGRKLVRHDGGGHFLGNIVGAGV
ncbi:hypothetical protein D3C71_1538700 [compost metagenome]